MGSWNASCSYVEVTLGCILADYGGLFNTCVILLLYTASICPVLNLRLIAHQQQTWTKMCQIYVGLRMTLRRDQFYISKVKWGKLLLNAVVPTIQPWHPRSARCQNLAARCSFGRSCASFEGIMRAIDNIRIVVTPVIAPQRSPEFSGTSRNGN